MPYYDTGETRITAKNPPRVKGCDGLPRVGTERRGGDESRDLPFWDELSPSSAVPFCGGPFAETIMAFHPSGYLLSFGQPVPLRPSPTLQGPGPDDFGHEGTVSNIKSNTTKQGARQYRGA
jgi:hypothetical protein